METVRSHPQSPNPPEGVGSEVPLDFGRALRKVGGEQNNGGAMPEQQKSTVVVAIMKVNSQKRNEVRAALLKQVERVHQEESDVELFAAFEAKDGFVLIEKWGSPEAVSKHASGEALAEYRVVLDPALDRPLEIEILTPLPAGDVKKGQL